VVVTRHLRPHIGLAANRFDFANHAKRTLLTGNRVFESITIAITFDISEKSVVVLAGRASRPIDNTLNHFQMHHQNSSLMLVVRVEPRSWPTHRSNVLLEFIIPKNPSPRQTSKTGPTKKSTPGLASPQRFAAEARAV